ncbi:hypothetical protein Ae201684P_019579 [Aphanomyces euteiches]|nr:hypothetical protein Ae201684P_019579 [Aphanomyces euteiches]
MTIWNDVLDKIWIDELLHQANVLGQRSDTGFKKCAFLAALSKLNQSPGLKKPFTMAQLRSRNEVKKGEFSIVHKMATASGMGWEDSTCRVICTGTTWDAYFEENKKPSFSREWVSRDDETGQIPNDDVGNDDGEASDRRKRPSPSPEITSNKRNKSLASKMVNVFERYEETAEQELKILAHLVKPPEETVQLSVSERALLILQEDFGAKLTTDDMAIAFEVMENSTKARLFLHMQGEVRDVWLRRQIRVQAS